MIYDAFQQQAIDYIDEGHSVLVAAPTGAGKTVIAEHVINQCLKTGKKVIYTAPIKALSNQKYREFQATAPDRVGILTGDVTLNAGSAVQIMTTEIFRNKILEGGDKLNDYSWIIFDEIHYLDDIQRGSVWEESLIFLPEHMKLLGLSATIPNIDQLAQWIESIHNRSVKIVKEDNRPVPLHFYYQCQGEVYEKFKQMVSRGFRGIDGYPRKGRLPHYVRVKPNRPTQLIQHLSDEKLFPCIYFVFSRKRTEYLAEEIQHFNFLNDQERGRIKALYDQLCERYDLKGEPSAEKVKPLILRGIGYHHAGMLPTLKEAVEQLFTSKLLKVIFTTETFALGINMPAKSVVFDDLRKIYGNGFAPLKTRDFYQMAGRAGRRSIDTEGFVFTRVNPYYTSPDELYRIIHNTPERVNSQFNASYATILNLYHHYGEKLYDVYPRSFHHYQVRPFMRKRAVDQLVAKVNVLKELGQIEDEQLTEKGIFAGKVYGYELILSEMFDQGLLEELSVEKLGILCLSVVYEPRKGTHKPPLPPFVKEMEGVMRKVKRLIHKVERRSGMKELSKRCYFHLVPAMMVWMKGRKFDEALASADADEGEVVRFFRMTIQILREITDTPVSDQIKSRAREAIGLINRDVIDSEKQLRS